MYNNSTTVPVKKLLAPYELASELARGLWDFLYKRQLDRRPCKK